jgi:RimJ/RimL family protein N-acetyltransferase
MSMRASEAKRRDLGGAVYLRPLTETDFTESYLAWFRDPLITRFLDARNITRQEAIDHLLQGGDGTRWRLYAICETAGGRHIGNLKIGPIHWRHMISDLVTVIGERDAWGKGHARAAIRLGIDIAFGELNMRKLSASIDSRNLGSIKAYEAAGFEIEGALKDQFLDLSSGAPTLSDKVYVACFNPAFDPAKAAARLGGQR